MTADSSSSSPKAASLSDMTLQDMGWNDTFADHLPALADDEMVARIIGTRRNTYTLWSPQGTFPASLAGRFLQKGKAKKDKPALGDWVVVRLLIQEQEAVVTTVLPRRSQLYRLAVSGRPEAQVIAANIDYVFVVMGLHEDFSVRRLERFLAAIHNSGATPVVLLNKADMCSKADVAAKLAEVATIAPTDHTHAVSAANHQGLDALVPYTSKGTTIALVGSSGVGKSTLVNALLGEDKALTGAVREGDGKGRHTTTWRELFVLPGGALLIDNPGIRDVAAWDNDIDGAFADITALAAQCRYRNCTHTTEDGCAVQAAITTHTLQLERLKSYRTLQAEAAALGSHSTPAPHSAPRSNSKHSKTKKRPS